MAIHGDDQLFDQRQLVQGLCRACAGSENNGISLGLSTKRASSRVSSPRRITYRSTSRDLVDAFEEDEVNLSKMHEDQLPAEMCSLDEPGREKYAAHKAREPAQ